MVMVCCILQEKLFEPLHAGNYHPTFEVFLDKDVTEVRIKIQLKIKESDTINFKNAWKRWIILKNNTGNYTFLVIQHFW